MERTGRIFTFVLSTAGVAGAIACGSTAAERSSEVSDKVVWSDAQDRYVMEPSACPAGWTYDYITNSCHHAANNGVDAGNDGVFSCTGASNGPYGHTVNWDIPTNGTVCLAEPQSPNSAACCWSDPSATVGGGAPGFGSAAAQACVKKMCGDQYIDGGGSALDAGATWPVEYLDCSGNNPGNLAACESCCDTNANQIPGTWGDAAIDDRENYRSSCKAACKGGQPTPAPPGPPAPPKPIGPIYQPPAPHWGK